jgi:hypothetical protein
VQATKSINSYGVHAVVANILETRKEVVQVVRPVAAAKPSDGIASPAEVRVDEVVRSSDAFIEAPLVRRIVELHQQYRRTSL